MTNSNKLVTVLTPTYNRKKELYKLYQSLINQTSNNFVWFVVDDGSNDNTKNVIEKMRIENRIEIVYKRKENGGKHKAINFGLKYINTDLTFIVDSDDILTEDAIENIEKINKKYYRKKDVPLCGYSFLRQFPNGNINGKMFPRNEEISDYVSMRINRNDVSDKAEVWFTDVLKGNPFDEFEEEKFLGEDILWIRLAAKYKMVYINKAIYIGNYLSDGLTNNRRKNNIKSPKGCRARAKVFLDSKANLKIKIKATLQYNIYSLFAKEKVIDKENNHKISCIMLFPISYIIYVIWKEKIKDEDSNDRS